MSVASNSSGSYSRATNVPAPSNFTVTLWMRWTAASLSGNFFQSIFAVDGAQYMQLGSGGGTDPTLNLYCGVGTGTTAIVNPGTAWRFVAIVGTASNTSVIYDRAEGANALTSRAGGGGSTSATGLYVLRDSNGTGQRADLAEVYAVKVWDAQLTAAEVLRESYFTYPVRRASLNSFFPFFGASGADKSGLGRDLTVGGTPIFSDQTPRIRVRGAMPHATFRTQTGNTTILPTGIPSAEAFGTPTVANYSGVPSAEAFGIPTVTYRPISKMHRAPIANTALLLRKRRAVAIDAFMGKDDTLSSVVADQFLADSVVFTILPDGIPSGEAFGTPTVTVDPPSGDTISPVGIPSAEAFGTPRIDLEVSPTGIASSEAFGTPTVTLGVAPSSIPSAEAFGSPTITLGIAPTGIPSSEAFGTPSVGLGVAPAGIPSAEAFGTPTLTLFVSPTGIPSAEAFGVPTVAGDGTIVPVGIPSAEAFGTPTVTVDALVSPAGIPSAEAFGVPTLTLFVSPVGISSAEAFGTPTVIGDVTISPTGIPSAEAFGVPTVTVLGLYAPSTPSRLRTLTIQKEDRTMIVEEEDRVYCVPREDRVFVIPGPRQPPVVIPPYTVGAVGIPSAEAFGTPNVQNLSNVGKIWQTTFNSGQNNRGVDYDSIRQRLIMVCSNGTSRAYYSDDHGDTWTAISTIPSQFWVKVAYSPTLDMWLACSLNSGTPSERVAISTDGGATWSNPGNPGVNPNFSDVRWNAQLGKFVIIGNDEVCLYDGTTFELYSMPVGGWNTSAFNGARLVSHANSGTNRAAYSNDGGQTWVGTPAASNSRVWVSSDYSPTLERFSAIASGGVTGETDRAGYSADGVTWIMGAVPSGIGVAQIKWVTELGQFVGVCSSSADGLARAVRSSDGITYVNDGALIDAANWQDLVYMPDAKRLCAVSFTGEVAVSGV